MKLSFDNNTNRTNAIQIAAMNLAEEDDKNVLLAAQEIELSEEEINTLINYRRYFLEHNREGSEMPQDIRQYYEIRREPPQENLEAIEPPQENLEAIEPPQENVGLIRRGFNKAKKFASLFWPGNWEAPQEHQEVEDDQYFDDAENPKNTEDSWKAEKPKDAEKPKGVEDPIESHNNEDDDFMYLHMGPYD